METGKEELIDKFSAPNELYNNIFAQRNRWFDKFNESEGG